VQAFEKYETYLMFCPGGDASKWVPLKKTTWQWSCLAEQLGSTWNPIEGSASAGMTSDTTVHPKWEDVVSLKVKSE
jgi:hypothetical protein